MNEEKRYPGIGLLIAVGGSLFLWAIIIWCASLLVGCSKAPPAKAPVAQASTDDCTQGYSRILAISMVQNLDPDHLYSDKEKQAAVILLDQNYRERGVTQQFFGHCISHMNKEQVSCMLGANTFEDMDLCSKLFAAKK